MNSKAIISVLVILLIALSVYTYTLQSRMKNYSGQQKTIDSLQVIVNTWQLESQLAREKAEEVIVKTTKQADSLRAVQVQLSK